jgi:hypothetical protein
MGGNGRVESPDEQLVRLMEVASPVPEQSIASISGIAVPEIGMAINEMIALYCRMARKNKDRTGGYLTIASTAGEVLLQNVAGFPPIEAVGQREKVRARVEQMYSLGREEILASLNDTKENTVVKTGYHLFHFFGIGEEDKAFSLVLANRLGLLDDEKAREIASRNGKTAFTALNKIIPKNLVG